MEEIKDNKFCDMCGAQLGQNDCVCPSCGKKLVNEKNVTAIIGFILSLIPATTMIGLVVSIVGLAISKSMKGAGKGLAIMGIIASIIYIVIFLFILYCGWKLIESFPWNPY